jgi:hypothetical protein
MVARPFFLFIIVSEVIFLDKISEALEQESFSLLFLLPFYQITICFDFSKYIIFDSIT